MMQTAPQFHCDWITVSQEHGRSCRQLIDVVVTASDNEGVVQWKSERGFVHEGSHSSKVLIKSNGLGRISLSGNIGRLNRPDNVFGYSLDDCKKLANELLENLDLPPFAGGEVVKTHGHRRGPDGTARRMGATVSRVDICENFALGSEKNRSDYLYWLTSQKLTKSDLSNYGTETVYFGKKSSYVTLKVYDKVIELQRAVRKLLKKPLEDDVSLWRLEYLQDLLQFVSERGLVRCEAEFGRKFLHSHGLTGWDQLSTETIRPYWLEYRGKTMDRTVELSAVADLPSASRGVYHAYVAGENVRAGMSKTSFYRHRNIILMLGVDIARPLNVRALNIKPKVVEVRESVSPQGYYLPYVS